MCLFNKTLIETTPEKLQKWEKDKFKLGPLSVFTPSVKNNKGLIRSHHMKLSTFPCSNYTLHSLISRVEQGARNVTQASVNIVYTALLNDGDLNCSCPIIFF
uniref:Uncharacterized protein n=1 Tax=Neovison vison TaxID=452646 RepID=A0A8C7AHC7_NEOVI